MNAYLYGLLILSVVGSSAIVTYLISISRERLWLRSQKSEELYRRAEKTYVDGLSFFRTRYDMTQNKTFPRANDEMAALNENVSELNILVGLYFPALGPQLAAATNSLAVAFDRLRLAEASDLKNRERALDDLDLAVGGIREAFDHFKAAALSRGRIDRHKPAGAAAPRRASRAAIA
ncbi:hypothetical protein CCR94_01415 [Rhodoblastus sphagnicola]|uniref:Uncharacterized protein n=1 Tax=Rhodoblastus sphagnicola TaxID=333368 RepID=A0A2S6NG46_9HYPH|nr:hypothetical protein [Rhodoblastus sphagnicola]MBB4199500.1 hypothetical protein [Rhodoblastus sphagnicola]PPQ33539.1 hypothetical protein CCR94_01415 [Rhodoblastus sphagnicola]